MSFPLRKKMNRRKKAFILSSFMIFLLLLIFVSGLLIGEPALSADFSRKGLPPSFTYPFGTDWLGRNMFLRTLKGLSLSLIVGTVGSLSSAVLATIIGMTAGMGSKKVDSFLTWCIDLVMGIPHLVLLILIAFACGRGLRGLLLGIALTHWTGLARLIRSEVLQLRSQPYIAVSKRLGQSPFWILKNHMIPHLIPQFIIGLILLFPHAILHESALSFLGYGLPPEQPAIGIILAESMKYLTGGMWWLAFFPGVTLVIVVLLFDQLGEHVKFLFDPTTAQF